MRKRDTVTGRAAWSPQGYCSFALEHQLVSLWQIASWIVRAGRSAGAFSSHAHGVLDLGAGPAIVSNMVARQSEHAVDALVQNPQFLALARELVMPEGMSAASRVRLHADTDGSLAWRGPPAALIYSYACLHEQPDPAATVARAFAALAPGGTLVLIDTLRERADEMRVALAATALPAEDRAAILATFHASLSLEEADAAARAACPGAEVAPLELDDELLLEAALSLPASVQPSAGPALEAPTLFAAICRRPAEGDERAP
jgi:SAM-dependent methyltransferase